MKKSILLLFLFCCSICIGYGQQVELNKSNAIEINAVKANISETQKTEMSQLFRKYDLYEFNLEELDRQVKKRNAEYLLNFKWPDKNEMEVSIFEHDLRSPDFRSVVVTENGEVELPRIACHTFKGYSRSGEKVRLNITDEKLSGFIQQDGELLIIESMSTYVKGSNVNYIIAYQLEDVIRPENMSCPNNEESAWGLLDDLNIDTKELKAEVQNTCIFIEFATDADVEYFNINGPTAGTTNAAIRSLLNLAEGLYFDEFSLNFLINFQSVWALDPDPYTSTVTEILLNEVSTQWTTNPARIGVPRDYVFFYTGKSIDGGATGGAVTAIGALCNSPAESYGFVASTEGMLTMGHEIGHALNATHKAGKNCGGWFGDPTIMCPYAPDNNPIFSNKNRTKIINHINGTTSGGCLVNPVAPNLNTSFEGGIGSWLQMTNDDFNWTVSNSPTPTGSTGPSVAYDQSFFLYTEANGNNNQQARLLSPPYLMCNPNNTVLSFGYHLHGKSMGTISVDISTDGAATWENLWIRGGNYGDFWNTAAIDLSSYALQTIRLRITGSVGDGNTSDMAIDDIGFRRPCKLEVDENLLIFPQEGGNLTFNIETGENWEANISAGASWISFNDYNGAGNQTITVTCPANNATGGRNGFATISCGGTTANLTIVQAGNPPNTDPCTGPFASIPHNASFESLNLSGWSQDADDDFDWIRDANGTPTSGTGPSSASAGSFYMYTEADNHANQTANLISPCIDLDQVPSPELTFDYHMWAANNADMGTLKLQVSGNGGFGWYTLWTNAGNVGNGWQTATVDLSNYQSVPILIRFNGRVGNGVQSDMAIDDVEVGSAVCYDIYENNNTFQDAKSSTIGPEVDYPNACLSAGDYDYYRYFYQNGEVFTNFYIRVKGSFPSITGAYRLNVTIVNGTSLVAETFPEDLAGCDTYIELFNNLGSWVAADDNGGTGLFSKITANIPPYIPPGQENRIATMIEPEFELSNFPNPFNQITTFTFSLKEESKVNLSITDISGKVIAMPINNVVYSDGNHQLEFDASVLAAGVYTYTLKTKDGLNSKQMVIVR